MPGNKNKWPLFLIYIYILTPIWKNLQYWRYKNYDFSMVLSADLEK